MKGCRKWVYLPIGNTMKASQARRICCPPKSHSFYRSWIFCRFWDCRRLCAWWSDSLRRDDWTHFEIVPWSRKGQTGYLLFHSDRWPVFKYISVADRAAFSKKVSRKPTSLLRIRISSIKSTGRIFTLSTLMMVSSAVENTERSFRIKIQYSQNIQKLSYTNFTVMLSTRPSTQALPMMLTKTLSSATANTGIPSSAVRTAISSII